MPCRDASCACHAKKVRPGFVRWHGRLHGLTVGLVKDTFAFAMVAEASNRRSAPLYEVRSFRSQDAVGALVALARKALAEEFERELEPLGLNAAQALVVVMLADERSATAA